MNPFPSSLGDEVCDWIERRCVHGPGDVYGDPVRLTAGEHLFLDDAYRLDPKTGRRQIDQAVFSRRKGLRKSELGAWLVHAECLGPTRAFLDGGELVLAPPPDPWVVCAATTEDQSELVYGAFRAIAKASDVLASLYDVGMEVTNLRGRPGKVELTQSRNAAALDGARPTFEVADESHLWLPALHESFNTLRRNLRKRKAAQPWLFLPTTAYRPGERSVAELIAEEAAGRRVVGRILWDHLESSSAWDIADADQLRAAIEEAAADAEWSDTDAIVAEFADPASTEADNRRYWLNQRAVPADQFVIPDDWAACTTTTDVDDGELITVGFDGGRYDDATAIVACRVSDGFLWLLGLWEKPDGPAGDGWSVPVGEVDAVMVGAFDRWQVWRAYCDPPLWQDTIARWQATLGDKRVIGWETNRPKQMGHALERFATAVRSGEVSHSGDHNLARHAANAIRRTDRTYLSIGKRRHDAKIDAAVAAVIAYEARGDAVAAGAKKRSGRAAFV